MPGPASLFRGGRIRWAAVALAVLGLFAGYPKLDLPDKTGKETRRGEYTGECPPLKVRIFGIDAVELKQAFSTAAKEALSDISLAGP